MRKSCINITGLLTLFRVACLYEALSVVLRVDEHVVKAVEYFEEVVGIVAGVLVAEIVVGEPVEIVVGVPVEIVAVEPVGIVAEEPGLVGRIVVADLVETVGLEVVVDDPVETVVAVADIGRD